MDDIDCDRVSRKLLIFALLLESFVAQKVPCEDVQIVSSSIIKCNMIHTTVISSLGVEIAPQVNDINALDFSYNEKISYLPTGLSVAFRELKSIDADFCSIKNIYKENFKNLNKLKYLDLDGNQIERIEPDTFEDLTALKTLTLSITT